jgi:CubicO group peptidase (beta-lactamase class C family)
MTHTTLELTPDVQRHLAKGYEMAMGLRSSFESDAENKKGRGYKVPNGAIYTTVGDMAKFASFLMGDGPASCSHLQGSFTTRTITLYLQAPPIPAGMVWG